MSTTLRGLGRRVKELEERLHRMQNPLQPQITLSDIDTIDYKSDTYSKISEGIYQTPKDGIVDQVDGEDRYGHKILNLDADGTGNNFRVARVYWASTYTTISSSNITWSIVDKEVVIDA